MGGENGIIDLGFYVVANLFIEEIRTARYYMNLLLENNNVLNLELWLTDNGLNKLDEVLIIIYNYVNSL